jgi:hypothetical protein
MVMIRPGSGSAGGTMLIMSARIPTKWTTPVVVNTAANPPRRATGHGRSRRTPAAAAPSSASVTTTKTMSGTTMGPSESRS